MWQLQQRYAALRDKPYFSYAVGLYVTLFVQLVCARRARRAVGCHALTRVGAFVRAHHRRSVPLVACKGLSVG